MPEISEPELRPTPAAPAIEFHRVTKHYGRRAVLDEVSFTVSIGSAFGLLGPNGAGKTTAIAVLLGLTRATSGGARILGSAGEGGDRAKVGVIVEAPSFFPHLSAVENLRLSAVMKDVPTSDVDRVIQFAGLWNQRNDQCRRYSVGMKQRLALAGALLGDPEVLVLDEPTNGLDPSGMRDMRDLILSLRDARKTVFLSSHLLSEVSATCDAVAMLRQGKLVFHGPVSSLGSGEVVEIELRGRDLEEILHLAEVYPDAVSVRREAGFVIVEAYKPDAAALNRHFASRGVFLEHLRVRDADLEDAFLRLTR